MSRLQLMARPLADFNPKVKPDITFPGGSLVQQFLNNGMGLGLACIIGAIMLGAGLWGLSALRGSPEHIGRAKAAIVAGVAGALILGLAVTIATGTVHLGQTAK